MLKYIFNIILCLAIFSALAQEETEEEETKKDEQENFDDITLFDMTKDESSISLQAPNMSNSNFDDLDLFCMKH